eukprot:TRINITY_DN2171_c0_g4_i1.p1 TRINITY_DN2171_c0_g4~~TRINITY_DN2171_c0_g4_i1.p1  ORF type:complete len:881 (-),score=233.52 TRINITY_DN2171_c0_g4_i1:160-2700(-)
MSAGKKLTRTLSFSKGKGASSSASGTNKLSAYMKRSVQNKVRSEFEITIMKVESMPATAATKEFSIAWRRGRHKENTGETHRAQCNGSTIDWSTAPAGGEPQNKAIIHATLYYDNKLHYQEKEVSFTLKIKGKKTGKTYAHTFVNLGDFGTNLTDETKAFPLTASCTPAPTLHLRIRTRWDKHVEEKEKDGKEKEKEKEKESQSPKTLRETPTHGFFGETIRDGLLVDGQRKYCVTPLIADITKEIETRALDVEGLFRIAGSYDELEKLKAIYEARDKPKISEYNPHTLCGVIKHYLRSLSEPLVPFDLYDTFVQLGPLPEPLSPEQIITLKSLLDKLPCANRALLKHLCKFLRVVAKKSDINKMTTDNLSIIFGPSLLRPPSTHPAFNDPMINLEHSTKINSVIKAVIDRHEELLSDDVDFGPEDGLFADSDMRIQLAAKDRLINHLRDQLQRSQDLVKYLELELAHQKEKTENFRHRAEETEQKLKQETLITRCVNLNSQQVVMSKDDPEIPLPAYELATYLIGTHFADPNNAQAVACGQALITRLCHDMSQLTEKSDVQHLAISSSILHLLQKAVPKLFPGNIKERGIETLPNIKELPFYSKLHKFVIDGYYAMMGAAFQQLESTVIDALLQDSSEIFDEPRSRFSSTMKMITRNLMEETNKDEEKKLEHALASLSDIVETLLAYHIFPSIVRSCFEELFYMIDAASFNRLLQQRSLCTTKNGLNIKMKLSQLEHWISSLDQSIQPTISDALSRQLHRLPQVANFLVALSNKGMFSTEQQLKESFPMLNNRQMLAIFDAALSGKTVSKEVKILFEKMRSSQTMSLTLLVEARLVLPTLPLPKQ